MPKSPMSYEALASPHTSTIWRTVLPSHHAGPRLTENIKCFQERLISWLSFQREYISIFSIWRSTTVWSTTVWSTTMWSTRLRRRFWRFWKSRFPSDPDARSQFDSQYNTFYFCAIQLFFFDTRGMHTMQHYFSVGGDYNKGFHNKYCKI